MIRSSTVLTAILATLSLAAPPFAFAQHAGHASGMMTALEPSAVQPGHHLEEVTRTLRKVDAALEKLTTSIDAVGAPQEGRLDVRQPLLALAREAGRTSSAIGHLVMDPGVASDNEAAEALHAAAKNLEQLTKRLEGLTKNMGRAVEP